MILSSIVCIFCISRLSLADGTSLYNKPDIVTTVPQCDVYLPNVVFDWNTDTRFTQPLKPGPQVMNTIPGQNQQVIMNLPQVIRSSAVDNPLSTLPQTLKERIKNSRPNPFLEMFKRNNGQVSSSVANAQALNTVLLNNNVINPQGDEKPVFTTKIDVNSVTNTKPTISVDLLNTKNPVISTPILSTNTNPYDCRNVVDIAKKQASPINYYGLQNLANNNVLGQNGIESMNKVTSIYPGNILTNPTVAVNTNLNENTKNIVNIYQDNNVINPSMLLRTTCMDKTNQLLNIYPEITVQNPVAPINVKDMDIRNKYMNLIQDQNMINPVVPIKENCVGNSVNIYSENAVRKPSIDNIIKFLNFYQNKNIINPTIPLNLNGIVNTNKPINIYPENNCQNPSALLNTNVNNNGFINTIQDGNVIDPSASLKDNCVDKINKLLNIYAYNYQTHHPDIKLSNPNGQNLNKVQNILQFNNVMDPLKINFADNVNRYTNIYSNNNLLNPVSIKTNCIDNTNNISPINIYAQNNIPNRYDIQTTNVNENANKFIDSYQWYNMLNPATPQKNNLFDNPNKIVNILNIIKKFNEMTTSNNVVQAIQDNLRQYSSMLPLALPKCMEPKPVDITSLPNHSMNCYQRNVPETTVILPPVNIANMKYDLQLPQRNPLIITPQYTNSDPYTNLQVQNCPKIAPNQMNPVSVLSNRLPQPTVSYYSTITPNSQISDLIKSLQMSSSPDNTVTFKLPVPTIYCAQALSPTITTKVPVVPCTSECSITKSTPYLSALHDELLSLSLANCQPSLPVISTNYLPSVTTDRPSSTLTPTRYGIESYLPLSSYAMPSASDVCSFCSSFLSTDFDGSLSSSRNCNCLRTCLVPPPFL